MQILICIILSLIVIGQITLYLRDFLVVKRNYEIYIEDSRRLMTRVKELEKTNKDYSLAFKELMFKKYSKTAFIVCAEGVKLVPESWKELLFPVDQEIKNG